MSRSAAVFDLDRTLLDGASWPIFHRALQRHGVVDGDNQAAARVLFGLFRGLGETYLTMRLTRLAVSRTRGWRTDAVDAAASDALPELTGEVHPYARVLFEEHRARGDVLVLATTTPQRLAAPLAAALGFDVCIGTRYGERDGAFDGTVDGPFVWNRGKLDAVRAWAAEAGVSLRTSSAYSDSFFDAPLLDAVAHPTAVNPDPRLAVLAGLRGWPVRWLDKPAGVVKLFGRELQELARPLLQPSLVPNARFELVGMERLPSEGGFILCANHRSYFDPTAVALLLARAGRTCRFLGKKEVFEAPVVGPMARALGGIRVDRGSGSDEPLAAAAQALAAGDVVAIMPQGTIPRGMAFFDPVLRGRIGAARLAGLTGVPVVPVGLWGTEAVWPRSSRLPRLDLLDPPLVRVVVGEPMHLAGRSARRDTERIMAAISELLPPEARHPHEPSDDELRRTFPPGYRGDLRAGPPAPAPAATAGGSGG
ncbi:MAG: HAD-IB family hydrolase [Acidimicrobiia bacterium]